MTSDFERAESERKARFEIELASYLEEMRAIARKDARDAVDVMVRRGQWQEAEDATLLNMDVQAELSKDALALECGEFLDREIERALSVKPWDGTLLGDDAIRRVFPLFEGPLPSPSATESLFRGVSMVRQALELGVHFYEFRGDELMPEVDRLYGHVGLKAYVGLHEFANATSGGLIVSGGTRQERLRIVQALRVILTTQGRRGYPSPGVPSLGYYEEQSLYELDADHHAQIRRRLLISPPDNLVFGTDNLESFIEQAPQKLGARILTYLFMDGKEHLDLAQTPVHAGSPPPERARPAW